MHHSLPTCGMEKSSDVVIRPPLERTLMLELSNYHLSANDHLLSISDVAGKVLASKYTMENKTMSQPF